MRNLIQKNIREFFQIKKVLFLGGLLILLFSLSFLAGKEGENGQQKPFVRIGVVDLDESKYTNLLISMFEKNETFSKYAELVKADQKQCETWFLSGEITAYLIIPKGFVQKMIYWEEGNEIQVRINGSYTLESVMMQNLLDGYQKSVTAIEKNAVVFYDMLVKSGLNAEYIDKKNIEVSMAMIMKLLNREQFFHFEEMSQVQKTNLLEYYLEVMIGVILLYGSICAGIDILSEREKKTVYRLKSAGISMWTFFLSKVIFYGGLIGILLGICFFLTDKMDIRMFLYDWSFAIFFLSMSVGISTMCYSRQVFVMTANICYFSFLLLGGGLIPTAYLPDMLVAVGRFTPFYWYLNGRNFQNLFVWTAGMLAVSALLLLLSVRYCERMEVPDAE